MSDLNAAIYNILDQNIGVDAVVNGRIFPDQLEQNATLPAITYWRVSGISYSTIDGSVSGLARARVTVETYAATRKAANELMELVRVALINARGTYDGTQVRNCLVDTHQQHYTDSPTDGNSEVRYVTAQDFNFHYVEDVS